MGKANFLFLGTGGSTGIPVIGCKCSVCLSTSPYNQRFRPSALLTVDGKKILIDVGPDFRDQALKYKIDSIDGLLLTHTHFDHIAGIDELRVFYIQHKKRIPCLLSKTSLTDLQERYNYFFRPVGEVPNLSAQIDFHILKEERGKEPFLGLDIEYCTYLQGDMKVNGFRFKDFAYITDIKEYKDSIFLFLKGVKTLVLSALRKEFSPLHLTLDDAVEFSKKVGAERVWLTHISHRLDHEEANRFLPKHIQLGFDGLEFSFEV